jgi:hypothetical protein
MKEGWPEAGVVEYSLDKAKRLLRLGPRHPALRGRLGPGTGFAPHSGASLPAMRLHGA